MNWRNRILTPVWVLAVFLTVLVLSEYAFWVWDVYGVSTYQIAGVAAALSILMRPREFAVGRRALLPPFILVPALLVAAYAFMHKVFGAFDLAPIIFHLQQDTDVAGVEGAFIEENMFKIVYTAVLVAALYVLFAIDGRLRRVDGRLAAALTLFNPVTLAALVMFGSAQAGTGEDLVASYRVPAISLPEGTAPKNVIHIFLESAERTLSDEDAFGDVMAPLAPYRKAGIEFTEVGEAEMTGWTLAGHVAAMCGVPLPPLGLFTQNTFTALEGTLLPGATCLPEVLGEKGHVTSFMKGAPLAFAGTDKFVAGHGFERTLGHTELVSAYPDGGNPWGLDDEDTFAAAGAEVRALKATGRPFYLAVTNIGGHTPDGYVSRSCKGDARIASIREPILQAFKCANILAAGFIETMRSEGMLENTVVIIQSDHLAMRNRIWSDLRRAHRTNLFVAFGDGIAPRVIDKHLTMPDMYATVLELAGYDVADHRAGIGVSGLSADPSLAESLGREKLDRHILASTGLRDFLWGLQNGS